MARRKCPKHRKCPSAITPLLAGMAFGAMLIYFGASVIATHVPAPIYQ